MIVLSRSPELTNVAVPVPVDVQYSGQMLSIQRAFRHHPTMGGGMRGVLTNDDEGSCKTHNIP